MRSVIMFVLLADIPCHRYIVALVTHHPSYPHRSCSSPLRDVTVLLPYHSLVFFIPPCCPSSLPSPRWVLSFTVSPSTVSPLGPLSSHLQCHPPHRHPLPPKVRPPTLFIFIIYLFELYFKYYFKSYLFCNYFIHFFFSLRTCSASNCSWCKKVQDLGKA